MACQVPPSADTEARVLLGLQAEYEASSKRAAKSLRRSVVFAAENVAALVDVRRRPKTNMEIKLEILRVQEECIRVLRRIEVSVSLSFLR